LQALAMLPPRGLSHHALVWISRRGMIVPADTKQTGVLRERRTIAIAPPEICSVNNAQGPYERVAE
jgi:hypothetical protein